MSCKLSQQSKWTALVCNLTSVCLVTVTLLTASVFAKDGRRGMQVIAEVKHDTSLPLRDLESSVASQATTAPRRVLPLLFPHPVTAAASVQADTALQNVDLPFVSASPGLNFEGLGQGQFGFIVNAAPPDTNGVVGATQYVQWVNSSFAVFDKATGAKLLGPTAGNAFWAGFGGGCQSNNDGDPVIQYDKMANRWVATQFSVSTTPFLQCVAVSTTNDATGGYNRYAFALPDFNDYPKLGIWLDGYYFSFNMFNAAGTTFLGAAACAANRTAMLAGNTATMVCFQQSSSVASLLPSDMDGTIRPTSGEPAFFMNFGTNSLNLWKFHVDFITPANSTFTGPTTLAVASFTPLCNGGDNCVVQPGTTQKLDSLADRLMYRLPWRKFADGHESLVMNHAISTGIRWYEIQNPNGGPVVFQQGTFHPTADTRWMGSIAMDQAGDIALGYSESSGSVHPSVFFTGREPSDPAGALQAEAAIVNGTGSQTGGLSRWGDYSAMTVDPVDDCTFWYTQEYMRTTGSFNWNTRIANFKFPNCNTGGGIPAVTLSVTNLAFGKRVLGTTSTAKVVKLTNTGTGTLNISSININGDFAISAKTCGTTVAVGASCTVSVTFRPTVIGIRNGTLTFNDDAPTNPQKVALTGIGTQISLSPVSLNFGTVAVSTTSAAKSVTVTNVGTTAVTFTGFSIGGTNPGDYLLSGKTCGTSLAGGGSCTVTLQFKPTATGTRKGMLRVADNGGGSPQTASLTGVGQ
ncbi:MAG: choice-of-anchor D domain-containing protein [Acidobacteriia bacterium]|nr:choice-of-anchor D domain-containing protein [Terriglobia bacterium]